MKTLNQLTFILLLLLAVSCNNESKKITDTNDYNAYLEISENEMLLAVKEDLKFGEEKHEKEPNQFPYLSKIAASQSQIFTKTGNIEALINAEKNLIKANELSHYTKVGYLRALARNYISQHRFKESLELLQKAEANGEGLKATQKMLFDVYLELGNYKLAKAYLNEFVDTTNFDYLIRLSKWSDHRGNLDAAIKYMEQAQLIAESSNIPSTKQWVYTNLADYYGHAGKINASYNHYLKALKLNPEDAYAKKGIAWIVFSHERNPKEALRILNSIMENYESPDYYLLKAEIADFMGDVIMKSKNLDNYSKIVKNLNYGAMYNAHNVEFYLNNTKQYKKAIELAQEELKNRETPETYMLLANSYFKLGDLDKAVSIIEKKIKGKTVIPV